MQLHVKSEDPVNEEAAQTHHQLQRLMAEAEAEVRAHEKEVASLRKQGCAIVGEQWSAIIAEAASAQAEMRRLQFDLVQKKIELSRASHGPQSQAFAAAGRKAANLIEAAERARDDVLEKAMTRTVDINDATDDTVRQHYQSALYATTIFFDEVVRQAAELLEPTPIARSDG